MNSIMIGYVDVLSRHHDDPEDLDYQLTQLSNDIEYVAEGIVEECSAPILDKAAQLQFFLSKFNLTHEKKVLEEGITHAMRASAEPKRDANSAYDFLDEKKKQEVSSMHAAKAVTDATLQNAKPAKVSTSRSNR
jgi:hypothetical protein